jgi:2-succinyl-6-hydroxy-2,4-cyclohexadiene-1-carboxylate synthase
MQKIHCLHGFLGKPTDWDPLNLEKKAHFLDDPLFQNKTLKEAALAFNEFVATSYPTDDSILIGYSLGGRLAFHALCADHKKLWKKAIIIAAHPGLEDETEKVVRLSHDHMWEQRFRLGPWDEVLRDWNAQPLFNGYPLERPQKDVTRAHLHLALDLWSLGRQDNLWPLLKELTIPVLYIAGDKDEKFVKILERLEKHPSFSTALVKDAGHRLLWEKPKEVENIIKNFLFLKKN